MLATFSFSFKVNISFKWAGTASSHCFRLSSGLVWYHCAGQVFHIACIIIGSKHLRVPSFVYVDLISSRPPLQSQELNFVLNKSLERPRSKCFTKSTKSDCCLEVDFSWLLSGHSVNFSGCKKLKKKKTTTSDSTDLEWKTTRNRSDANLSHLIFKNSNFYGS